MEVISNLLQAAVTLLGFFLGGIRYLKSRKQEYFLLTCFYGCFFLGSLYWTMYLLLFSKTPEIDEKINEIAEGWRTRRMGKVELTILRLAVFEMKYDEEIPEKVAINEAVELAKKFGGDEAPAFVNGILAKLIQKGN